MISKKNSQKARIRNYHRGSHDVMGEMNFTTCGQWAIVIGSRTGETKSLGYFRKTEVQVPMLVFYFCEVQQWLAPKTLHGCSSTQPLFIQQILSNSSPHLFFSSKPRELRNTLYISKIVTCISESWLLYWGEPHRKSGKLQNSRILRWGGGTPQNWDSNLRILWKVTIDGC